MSFFRDVVEAWKSCLQVPHKEIFEKLSSRDTLCKKAAIEMTAIFLFHNMQPFSESNKER